jgi:small-conductance mechanosensitive channel
MGAYNLITNSLVAVNNIWNYVIISISNKEIKVANIILALGLIYLHTKIYKTIISKINAKIAASKFKDDKELIEKIVAISVNAVFIILILQIANVPLDTFAFLGGALALGLGLGVQNLINNLLSSLIIVVEKPLKIGDLVSVDGTTGKVEEIGNRCIKVRDASNAVLFIPSSSILQNKLVNWTQNQSLVFESKIKIPKKHAETPNIKETIKIIETGIKNSAIVSPKIILESSTILYYVYSMSYMADVNFNMPDFKHKFNSHLIDKLGPEVIIEHKQ